MPVETTDTVVVGAGQAGLAMSEHLSNNNVHHIVLERDRIAERWRSERWDSLVTNGPAWHDRFPNMEFPDTAPNSFVPKEQVADYFVTYAEMINAPVRCGVEVKSVKREPGDTRFLVETSNGTIEANNVVVATGPFQHPVIPNIVPEQPGLLQIHSSQYRNPEQLPDGAVLVVGAGSSGGQIADELCRAGRTTYLSIGLHDRPPRNYRGLDYCWWLGVLGKWDAPTPGAEHVTISVSGARGGVTVDFRRLAAEGMKLVGRTESFENGNLSFADNLEDNIKRGDANYLSVLDEADAYATRLGLNLPEDPKARVLGPEAECISNPIRQLNLKEAGITTIVWATGYAIDYSWLDFDIKDENGQPRHLRGISQETGLYFLGLPCLATRGSSFIYGVWHDARYIAGHIEKQRGYWEYFEGQGKN